MIGDCGVEAARARMPALRRDQPQRPPIAQGLVAPGPSPLAPLRKGGEILGRAAKQHERSSMSIASSKSAAFRATDSAPAAEPATQLVEHFFRHESGRLVSVLTRVFGLRNLDLVEDMVQSALVEALQAWRAHGVPDNPSAWMHRVARNKVVDALRHRDTVLRLAPAWAQLRPAAPETAIDDLLLDSEIEDSQLRLMFACCHPILARENQIALTLKSLCGFSNAEIARGLLVSDETVKKRVQRARQQLCDEHVNLEVPRAEDLAGRLDSVHQCLYLLFNEGYAASSGDDTIRTDLCEEAVRLCHLLCGHAHCRSPASFALLALMLFHAARFDARTDAQGKLLLLEDQDRTQWDQPLIARARYFLDQSAEGKTISLYHLEAGIALLHCTVASFAETNWRAILELYEALLRFSHPRSTSSIARLSWRTWKGQAREFASWNRSPAIHACATTISSMRLWESSTAAPATWHAPASTSNEPATRRTRPLNANCSLAGWPFAIRFARCLSRRMKLFAA